MIVMSINYEEIRISLTRTRHITKADKVKSTLIQSVFYLQFSREKPLKPKTTKE